MRRALVVLSLICLVSTAVGSAAAATRPVEATLTGAAVWSGPDVFTVQTFAVSGVVDGIGGGGTYSGTLEAGSYFTSATCGPSCAEVTGTIDFVTRRGSFTTTVGPGGLVILFAIGSGEHYQFSLPLTFSGGTRNFSHASGAFTLLYDSTLPSPGSGQCNPTCTVRDRGTLTGTISRPALAQ